MKLSRRIQRIDEPLIDTLATRARQLVARGASIANLGQALPGDRPPAAAMQAARSALARGATHVYSPDAGIPELRDAIARWIARYDGYRIDPGTQVIVTAGGNQALMVALQCCVDAGDDVLVPAPYFMNHEMAVRLVDAVPVEVGTGAIDGYVITARRLFGGPENPPPRERSARAVVITTPNNPTGAIVPDVELRRIARECKRRGIFLILDRTYAGFEFERQPDPQRLKSLPDHVLVVGSFSKVFSMTGWRVGYLAGPPDLIREALKAQDTMIICAPTIGQIAVTAALTARRGVAPAYLRELRRRRDYVQERLAEMPGWSAVPAAGGFFTFIHVHGCTDSTELAFRLLERHHVLVMPGRIFGEAGEGHIRISYGIADVATLRKAFDRIRSA